MGYDYVEAIYVHNGPKREERAVWLSGNLQSAGWIGFARAENRTYGSSYPRV